MPNMDGTGPRGQGPMTGKGMGVCPVCGCAYQNKCKGGGVGARRFWASSKNSLQDLKDIKSQLEQELEAVKNEIDSAEKQA